MSVKKVIVSEYSDGFSVDVFLEDGTREAFSFDQEDNKQAMVALFKMIGVKEVRYQEVY